MSNELDVLTTGELCAYLNVSRRKVSRWVKEGMPHFRVGEGENKPLRFVRGKVLEWLGSAEYEVFEEDVE